jgi:hypothetical protein
LCVHDDVITQPDLFATLVTEDSLRGGWGEERIEGRLGGSAGLIYT